MFQNFVKEWSVIELAEVVVDFQPGFAQKPNAKNEGVPQLRTNNITSEGVIDLTDLINVHVKSKDLERYRVKAGDVIFNNTNSIELVGKTAFFNERGDFVLSNHMTRIRVNEQVLSPEFLSKYLHYLWQTGTVKRWAKHWVNQAAIDINSLSRFKVIIPPLSEQQRIVEVLREVDNLRLLRREANGKQEKLPLIIFYEMFGNPVINSKGWEKLPFTQLGETRLGKMLDAKQNSGSDPKPYLRNINVQWNRLELSNLNQMNFKEAERTELRLIKGDVLICEGGEIGRSAIWNDELEECYFQKALHRVRPFNGVATSEYISILMWALAENNGFRNVSSQATIQHLTGEKLASLRVPKPPIELQREFSERYWQIRKTHDLQKQSSDTFESLKNSITSFAYTGKLTEKWREENAQTLQGEVRDFNQSISRITNEQKVHRDQNIVDRSLPKRDENIYTATRPINSNRIMLNRTELADTLSSKQQLCFSLVGFGNNYFNAKQIHALQEEDNLSEADLEQILTLLAESGLLRRVRVLATDILEDKQVLVPVFRLLNNEEIENNTRRDDLAEIRSELESLL